MKPALPIYVQVLLWIAFFVVQVTVRLELPLTVLAAGLSIAILYRRVTGEGILFLLGVAMAVVIEVGLGLIARSQVWSDASFLGIPYWLPLIWGYGFVVMRRVGNYIVRLAGGDPDA
jgi:hypothetical protein